MGYLREIFLSRREGLIVLFGSAIYLAIFILHTWAPKLSPVPWFYGMVSPYVAFFLLLTYVKMGGFKRTNFESGWFNTIILVLGALVPPLVAIKSAIDP